MRTSPALTAKVAPPKTKVLFVLHALTGGGAERVFVQLVNHLDRDHFVPMLALGAMEGPYLKDVRNDVPIHVLGAKRSRVAWPAVLLAVWRLRPDVVFSTAGLNLAVAMTRFVYPRGTRVVIREASSPSAFLADVRRRGALLPILYRMAYRLLYRQVDTVVCQSEFMVEDVASLRVPRPKLICIYNPVDVRRVKAMSAKPDPWVREPAAGQLVSVGRLAYAKGYDLLINAVAQLRDEGVEVRLRIFGEGNDRSALVAQASDLGLDGVVEFAGFHANPYPAIAHASLFVSSSRYEGFSNAIIEALACGTPVVATDCPSANREVIDEGLDGWFAPPDDAPALARTIRRALDERGALDQDEIRERCAARFDVGRIAGQYEEILHSYYPRA